ncbi:right-handed parallel beta-helix repeat-containing protein [Methylomonas sp. BW4-1]|uniref:right-handed parallel beta-helix repeat-containing protein n=1 Tax=Methylomonas sp. BW4-1 TaxID=3376685 RepID=UPI004042D84A
MLCNNFSKIALLCFSTTAMSQDFYIDPAGSDQANGLSPELSHSEASGPFLTFSRAQQAIRDLKKDGLFREPVTVHIQTGDYTLQKPLEFDLRDSGFTDRKIRWQAENGPVLISGGTTLQNCKQGNNKIWDCPTSTLKLDGIKYSNTYRKKGNIPGFQLFVDQQSMHLARWPNTDWAHIKLPINENTKFSSMENLPTLGNETNHAQIHIMAGNDWFDEYIGIAMLDQGQNNISLSSNTKYPLTSGRRFYLQNIQSELDAPGEWFYDQTNNKILFIPHDSSKPNKAIVSQLKNILSINGANYISFNNLVFRHSTETAINIDKASHILFDGIEISHIGGTAIEVKNCDHINISNSQINDTGEAGVLISGGDRATLVPANNIVHNNHIYNFGVILMTYTPGIEVSGVGTHITHNLIEHSPGAGILINGNDHLIEKNEVQHVCEQASDCGAIYSGRNWTFHGNVIRYNSIHDLLGYGLKSVDIANNKVVYAKPDGARGVYLDDAVSGFSIIGNIFNKAGSMAIQLGGGRDNIIENNVILTDSNALWIDNRWPGYSWSENKKGLLQVPYQSAIWRTKYPKLSETYVQ